MMWKLALIVWALSPFAILWALPVGPHEKAAATMSFVWAFLKFLVVLPFALTAPLVVPFVLLVTPKEADHLPRWAWPWDNEVSLNGDRTEYWDPRYGGGAYYSGNFGPRTYVARFIWLVLRNRASQLAYALGHKYAIDDYDDAQTWGDPDVSRSHEGWQLNRRGPTWQLYKTIKLGRLCVRINVGHKIWSGKGDGRPVAMVVFIPFTLVSWVSA